MSGNIFRISKINNQQTINSNRFSIRFVGLNDKLINKSKTSTLPGIQERYNNVKAAIGSDPATSLELSLFSATVPPVALEIQDIAKFNDNIKAVTKFAVMEDFTVTFVDYVNGSASAIMQLWHAWVGDKQTGAIGFKQDFVLPKAYFYVYGPDAPGYSDDFADTNGVPYLQKYEIINLFPKQIDLGEHSAESAESRKVTVNFAIDNFYPVSIRNYNYQATTPEERYSEVPAAAF